MSSGPPSRPLHVLTISPGMMPSVLLLADAPLARLAREGVATQRFRIPYDVRKEDLVWADVVHAIRSVTPLERRILNEARRLGRKTILSLDDNLFEVPRDAECSSYYGSRRLQTTLRSVLREVDLVLTPTNTLAEVCRPHRPQGPLRLAPVPALLLDEAPPTPRAGDTLTLGYAGGVDGATYLNHLLRGPLLQLRREYGDRLRLEFFGACPDNLDDLGGTHLPYEPDWARYKAAFLARRWDVGLAPLFDTPFHRCKYYNKFLEYGAAGAAGVYAHQPPYTEAVQDGINGLLVRHDEAAWYQAIKRLLDDADLRRGIANRAYQDVARQHGMDAVCAAWRTILADAGCAPAPSIESGDIRWNVGPGNRQLRRVLNFVDLYGWGSPQRAVLWLLWKCGLRARVG